MRLYRRPFKPQASACSTPDTRFARAPLAQAISLAMLLALGAQHAAQAQPQGGGAPVAVSIAAQPLSQALTELAWQTGATLVATPALLAGKQTPAVSGSLAPQQVLERLLAGSGLVGTLRDGVITVQQAPQGDGGSMLAEVTVSAQAVRPGDLPEAYAGGQVARGGRLGLLGNTDLMDAPFNITSYTAELVEDQQARSVADVVANDPSIRQVNSVGGYGDSFLIRGFRVPYINIALNGLYGLMPVTRVAVEAAERIEVLKGPSALLSGMAPDGAIGGTINVVPKRAADTPLTRLGVGFISDRQATTHVDIGRRLGERKEWGVRFNGAYRHGDTVVEGQSKTLGLGALGLDYRGDRLRLSLDAIYQKDDQDGTGDIGAIFFDNVPRPPKGSTPLIWGGYYHATTKVAMVRAEYDLTPGTTVYGAYGHRRDRSGGPYGLPVYNSNGNASVALYGQEYLYKTATGETGIRSRFDTGPVRHTLSLSANSYVDDAYLSDSYDGAVYTTNLYMPVMLSLPSYPGSPLKQSRTRLSSVAVADTLSLAGDRLLLTLGVRRQNVKVENFDRPTGASISFYDESATTPMLGLVFKPWQDVSLYANYIEGLQQGPTAPTQTGLTNAGQVFAPYKSKQYEAGIKVDWGSISTTASIFQIAKLNAITVDNVYSLDGKQRNRGIEFNVAGELNRGIRLLGGLMFMESKVVSAATHALEGKTPVGVPRRQLNLGAEWDVPVVSGLALNARTLYTGSQYIDATNVRAIPGWTRWDVGARYAIRLADKSLTLRASILNVLDRRYWSGVYSGSSVTLGAPRTAMLSATMDF